MQVTIRSVLDTLLPPEIRLAKAQVTLASRKFQEAERNWVGGTMGLVFAAFFVWCGYLLGRLPVEGLIAGAVVVAGSLVFLLWQRSKSLNQLALFQRDYPQYYRACLATISWIYVLVEEIAYAPGKVLLVVVADRGTVFPFLIEPDEVRALQEFLNRYQIGVGGALPLVIDTRETAMFQDAARYGVDFANLLGQICQATKWPVCQVAVPRELHRAAEQYLADSARVGAA